MEVSLPGGRSTPGVVRVGATVRRPVGTRSLFVRELLEHLESAGFSGAPRFLGVDECERDMFTYLPGQTPFNLEWGAWTDEQLIVAARLIRRYHDATAGSPLAGDQEVVCHNDLGPCNTVFVEGIPSAFIDFDAAAPGSRVWDLAYALWLYLNLGWDGPDVDEQARRIRMICDEYGFAERLVLVDAIERRQQLILRGHERNVRSGKSSARAGLQWVLKEIGWLRMYREQLERNLR